jgi:type IV secretion system protein VirB4
MLNVGAYSNARKPTLWDHLPWAALVAPGVVLNKDGSFLRAIRFRGPDLDSSTPDELVGFRARVNNALRRLGSGWCLYVESNRRPSRRYPDPTFPETPAGAVAALIDAERRASFTADHSQFESYCFLTFQYLPPAESKARLLDLFIDRGESVPQRKPSVDYRAQLDYFDNQVAQVVNLLAGILPEVVLLDDDELLSYLHDCVADPCAGRQGHLVRVDRLGDAPVFLDVALADAPFTGGLAPKLGSAYLKTVSLRAFSPKTAVCMLDQLNDLAIPYRWVVRWLPMDKADAVAQLGKLRRQWFAKRKGLWSILKEVITKEPSQLEDGDALGKAAEVDAALQTVGGDHASYGYLTLSITTYADAEQAAIDNARLIQQVVDSTGMVSQIEDFNAVQAWLGSLPGHVYADVRRPLVSSLNLCDLVPLSSVWSGPTFNAHLDAPVLMHAKARGGTAFRLDLHQGDVGHALVAGPTGAGKSTLLNLLAAQWQRYEDAQVFIFDKGASCRVLTEAMAGAWYEPGSDDGRVCFQPLADIDADADAAWAMEWTCELLRLERLDVDPRTKGQIWDAILNLRSMPRAQRTLSTLHNLIQNESVREALRSFTVDGAHGELLDADHDTFAGSEAAAGSDSRVSWIGIEMQHLMQRKSVAVPVLTYLFHELQQRFDGRPTLLVLDEAWLYLADTLFANKVHEWLKTLRKLNVSVLFATQSLADVANSSIAPAILENCLTRIYLPNSAALEPATRKIYESFGLNARQIQILATATPKQDYYYTSRQGNRLFQLDLGPVQLGLCGRSRQEDLYRLRDLRSARGVDWLAAWLSPADVGMPGAAIDRPSRSGVAHAVAQHEEDPVHA